MGRIAEALRKAEQQRREKLATTEPVAGLGEAPVFPAPLGFETGPESSFVTVTPRATGPAPRVEGMAESLVAYYDPSAVVSEQY
ncbi:MAG: hypothetical protein GY778_14800, partial [bacterium]|nr:hypothetical protein [bacterium]